MPKFRRRLVRYWPFFHFVVLTAIVTFIGAIIIKSIPPVVKIAKDLSPMLIMGTESLRQDNGRINIAILGVGGTGHEGPQMTDTIIIASVPATRSGKIALISVPRDIYIEALGDKINSAYTQGEEKKAGGGFVLTKAVLSQVTGLPIHYAVKFDFAAFEKIIDYLGGVDINIENTFTDDMYPIPGKENDDCGGNDLEFKCRYETITFQKGLTHMSGTTALKFARSRHSANLNEGTDFARAIRQQKLIAAIKNIITAPQFVFSPPKILEVYSTLSQNIFFDATSQELSSAIRLAPKLKNSTLVSIILNEDLFYNPPTDRRGWILLPVEPDFKNIKEYLQSKLPSQ